MTEKNKKPQIRFKGFTTPWEQRKLTDEVELFSGLTYSPNDIVKDNGTLVLRSSNVKNGEVIDADNVYVNSDVVNSSNVKNGDIIVVVRNGSRSLIGKHAQVKGEKDYTVIGAFMTGIRSDYSNFINALLDTPMFKCEIDKNLGATINQITNGMFHQMKFMIPKPEEQDKIGEIFTGIDKLINLHQRKYYKLQNVKKSMLEKMFPKNGADIPEIRFKGFTETWEQRKFEEIFKVSQGLQIEISKRFTEPGDNRYFYITNEFLKDNCDEKYYIESPSENVICDWEDILMTRTGNTGIVVTDVEGCFHNNFFKIQYDRRNFSKKYICYLLSSADMQKTILNSAGSSTIPDLSHKSFYKISGFFPKYKEQNRIAEYFFNLDNLITLHQRELDKLKNMKKACLEKMFI